MQKFNSIKKLLMIAVCLLFMTNINLKAQSSLITRAYAVVTSSQGNPSSGDFTVLLEDTTNVSQVKVMLGSEADSSDLVMYTFNYDVNTSLPSGFAWSRSGNTVTLQVGTFDAQSTYFGSVSIKDNNNTWRSSYNFITN